MRKLLLMTLVVLAMAFPAKSQKYLQMIETGAFTLEQIQREAYNYFEIHGTGKGSGYKQFKRWEYMASRELDANGKKLSNKQLNHQIRSYRKSLTKSGQLPPASGTTGNWQEQGPTYWDATSGWNPGVGRVTSVAVEEGNANHIIVGAPKGGVWKSTDGGQNWTVLTDDFQTIDVWSLEIDPSNASHYLWGGDGEIFESFDGGQNWSSTSMSGKNPYSNFIRIAFHPVNPSIVFAVGEYDGLFKSTNGGSNWTYVNGTDQSRNLDFEFKPGDPSTCYYITNRVYRSTDTGNNWTEIGGFETGGSSYKMAAVSPADPSIVYVLESSGGTFGAFYKSTNSGQSYTKLLDYDNTNINYFGYDDAGGDTRGQAPRDMDVAVSESNANEVHIAGIHTWKSTNGGQSFDLTSYWTPGGAYSRGVGYNHADIDILKFVDGVLYVGSDGGIYKSSNGATSFTDLSTGLGIREFYRIGVSLSDVNLVSGGAQDNGTSVMRGAGRNWKCWLGADGMETFIDWNNSNNLFGTTQNGSLYKSTNMGNSYSGISEPNGDGNWVTPFEQDPQNPSTIYVGYEEVWKSTNAGGNWTAISSFGGSSMDELKIARSNNQYIYASKGGTLHVTTNGGTSWSTTASPWSGSINYIAVHPTDEERVAVVTSSNVYISTDAGASWTDYTKNTPGTRYCAVWEDNGKNGLYVGGFGYIVYIQDGMANYSDFMSGLPNVRVYELEIQPVSNKIFAGTYGRGLWESDVFSEDLNDYDISLTNVGNVGDICGDTLHPSLNVRNNGVETISKFYVKVTINGNVELIEEVNVTLATGESHQFSTSVINYNQAGIKVIDIEVYDPDNQQDQELTDNDDTETITVSFGTAHEFYIHTRSENNGISWEIAKNNNVEVNSSNISSTTSGNFTIQEFCLADDCYDFTITDAFSLGGCNEPAWNASTVYLGDASLGAGNGEVVSYNGKKYRALWWTQGDQPDNANNWTEVGDCNVSYDSDLYGLRKKGEAAYFEVENQNYSSPDVQSFCSAVQTNVDFTADVTTINHCEDIVFSTSTNGTSFSWDFGADAQPLTANGEGPHTVQYLTDGTKTIELTVDGVTETKTNYVTVNEDQGKAATISAALTLAPTCEGGQLSILASGGNLGNNPTYTWYSNGQILNGENGSVYSTSNTLNGDSIYVSVLSDDNCALTNVATSSAIVISPSVNQILTSEIFNEDSWPVCEGQSVRLKGRSNATDVSFVWQLDGQDTTVTDSVFDFVGANDVDITVKITANSGCYTNSPATSAAMTSEVDICVGIDELEVAGISVFPNPAIDQFTIQSEGKTKVELLDATGRLVQTISVLGQSQVDVSELAAGNYFLRMEVEKGSVFNYNLTITK